jgi:hypothetical protein
MMHLSLLFPQARYLSMSNANLEGSHVPPYPLCSQHQDGGLEFVFKCPASEGALAEDFEDRALDGSPAGVVGEEGGALCRQDGEGVEGPGFKGDVQETSGEVSGAQFDSMLFVNLMHPIIEHRLPRLDHELPPVDLLSDPPLPLVLLTHLSLNLDSLSRLGFLYYCSTLPDPFSAYRKIVDQVNLLFRLCIQTPPHDLVLVMTVHSRAHLRLSDQLHFREFQLAMQVLRGPRRRQHMFGEKCRRRLLLVGVLDEDLLIGSGGKKVVEGEFREGDSIRGVSSAVGEVRLVRHRSKELEHTLILHLWGEDLTRSGM